MYLRGFEYEENNVNCITALEWDGAERSLIGFLEALDESKWEIDLFLLLSGRRINGCDSG